MIREILAQLDQRGEAGAKVQIQLARELAAMRTTGKRGCVRSPSCATSPARKG